MKSTSICALLACCALIVGTSCSKAPPGRPTDSHAGHDHDAEHVEEITLTSDAIQRYGVTISEAQLWLLQPSFVAPARVGFNTDAMAHVGCTLRGRAVEIPVKLGDRVRRGDALVVVESTELGEAQVDLLLKRNAAAAAAPQAELARASFDRAKELHEKSDSMSLTEVQKREAEYRTAQAQLQASEAAAAAAANALIVLGMDEKSIDELIASGRIQARFTIRAAIDGQVVLREVTLGESIGPDREALMVLADTSVFWVLADVPEARLPSVANGARAWVTVGSIAQRFEGSVAFVAPLVDPTTRTAQVRIEIPSDALGEGAIRPGMFAQVEIVATGEAQPPQIAVPQDAVQRIEGKPTLFVPVADEPNTFQKRAIEIGDAVGGLIPILSGLVEGERFVASGSFILKAEFGKGSAAHEH